MNIISIDPSLISTAVCINGKLFNYCRESDIYGKKGMSKWYKMAEQFVTYKAISYNKYSTYSEGEIVKLVDYNRITDQIISDIKENIDINKPTKVGIEGYSYSSDAGLIIDLVTFSTLLRKKIYDQITNDILVLSPSTLKQESCRLTYKPIDIGKKKPKFVWENNQGIKGGSFTKTEIFKSIIENTKFIESDEWAKHCLSISEEILSNKKINKPYEDLNDVYVLFKIMFLNLNKQIY